MSTKKFTVSIECEVVLSTSEIWPDGNAPESPTAKDVIQTMQDDCIDIGRLLSDWNLPACIHVWNPDDRNDRAEWD